MKNEKSLLVLRLIGLAIIFAWPIVPGLNDDQGLLVPTVVIYPSIAFASALIAYSYYPNHKKSEELLAGIFSFIMWLLLGLFVFFIGSLLSLSFSYN